MFASRLDGFMPVDPMIGLLVVREDGSVARCFKAESRDPFVVLDALVEDAEKFVNIPCGDHWIESKVLVKCGIRIGELIRKSDYTGFYSFAALCDDLECMKCYQFPFDFDVSRVSILKSDSNKGRNVPVLFNSSDVISVDTTAVNVQRCYMPSPEEFSKFRHDIILSICEYLFRQHDVFIDNGICYDFAVIDVAKHLDSGAAELSGVKWSDISGDSRILDSAMVHVEKIVNAMEAALAAFYPEFIEKIGDGHCSQQS